MTGRRGVWVALCWVGLLAASPARGEDKPRYAPPPAWVDVAPIPSIAASTDGSPIQILLEDTQTRLGADEDVIYAEAAVRILSPQGLAAMATIAPAWNPDTQTLTLHRLVVLRGDKTIDLLEGGKNVTVLRRETNLEAATLDGQLTATLQPEGLRVGDIVDFAMSVTKRDPVFQGRSDTVMAIRHAGVAGRVRLRAIWSEAKPIRWRATEGLPTPRVTRANGMTELVVDATNLAAPKAPLQAPARFADVAELEISQFQSWEEVSALMAPLYVKAAALAAGSPLLTEADRIRRASGDPKIRAEAALRLAQDQVHYVFLGMNFGGYVPADADVTWSRRFGDCKGKTALLLALLHGVGVEAEPALVSTALGDGLDQRLPSLAVFDHVFVRARIGPKVYWLDATRSGDRDLDDIPVPAFHWVLPIRASAAALERIEPPPLSEPGFESLERLDASGGFDAPAPAHLERIYRGDTAVIWRLSLDSLGRADAERGLKEQWRQWNAWIEPLSVSYAYDDAHHLMRLTMDGTAKMDWTRNGDVREFDIADSSLGFIAAFDREPGPRVDAPYAVNYPSYDRWTVRIVLPGKGAGFSLAGAPANVDTTIAARRYQRWARLDDGVATMVAEERGLAPEFAAADAPAAAAALRDLYRFNVVVRSPAASDAAGDDLLPAAPPRTAADYSLRGAAYLAHRDFDRAIADFSEAARLEPGVAKPLYDRGAARFEKGQDILALQDFDQVLRLAPRDTLAMTARGDLYMARGERALAEKDYAAALRLAPDPRTVLERRAAAHERAGLFEAEVRDDDAMIALAHEPGARPGLLNARCWARAEWGHELAPALTDCDMALSLLPGAADILDSRGLVNLRLARFKEAIEDYDAALAQSPNRAGSLFGRGLAQLGLSQKVEGRADLAAARTLSPTIDAEFARYGVRGPAAGGP